MFIGCCHCGEPPSESIPPSESNPPSSSQSQSQSSSEVIDEINDCQIYCGKKKTLVLGISDQGVFSSPWSFISNGYDNITYVYGNSPCPPSVHYSSGPSPVTGWIYIGISTNGVKQTYPGQGVPPMSYLDGSSQIWCFGCVPPTEPTIADATAGWLGPNLIYCGGDPHSYGVYCTGVGCRPTRVEDKVRYQDQSRALGSGSIPLVMKYYDNTISNTNPSHWLFNTGYSELRSLWVTNPLSRQWCSWDNKILGSTPFTIPNSNFNDLVAINAVGGSKYPDADLCGYPPGSLFSNYSCTYMGWAEDETHISIVTFGSSCSSSRTGSSRFLIRSYPKFRFSSDVLEIFRKAMLNLGRPKYIGDCFNAYNWQWFLGAYGRFGTTTRIAKYNDAFWTRPNFPVYKEKEFGWGYVRKQANSMMPMCVDVLGKSTWTTDACLSNLKRSATNVSRPLGTVAFYPNPVSPTAGYSSGACELCYNGYAFQDFNLMAGPSTYTGGTLINPTVSYGTGSRYSWTGGQLQSAGSVFWEDA